MINCKALVPLVLLLCVCDPGSPRELDEGGTGEPGIVLTDSGDQGWPGSTTTGAGSTGALGSTSGASGTTTDAGTTGPSGTATADQSAETGTAETGDTGEERPRIMFVLDKSGSMQTEWADVGFMPTRWSSLRGAIEDVVRENAASMEFAIKLFPSRLAKKTGLLQCDLAAGVEVPFGFGDPDMMLAQIPGVDGWVQGGTPTVGALQTSVAYLRSLVDDRPVAIVLVTDGRVTCGMGFDEVMAIAAASDIGGSPVYVVGIDVVDEMDPELPAALDLVASAGGTEMAQFAHDGESLREIVTTIVEDWSSR